MVPGSAGDREHQYQHAVSRHRKLAHRGTAAGNARLSAVRHPTRGVANAIAFAGVLSGTDQYPTRALRQASELAHSARPADGFGRSPDARTDQFPPRDYALSES